MAAQWMRMHWLLAVAATIAQLAWPSNAQEGECGEGPPAVPAVPPSSYGNDFITTIPKASAFGSTASMIIGTSSPSSNYTVETADGVLQTGDVSYDCPVTITFTDEDMVADSMQRDAGIHVTSDGPPIFVLVVTLHSSGLGNFLAYPTDSAQAQIWSYPIQAEEYVYPFRYSHVTQAPEEYVYYAISTSTKIASFSAQIVLVGWEDDTEVTITPTVMLSLPENTQNPDSDLVDVDVGESLTIILHKMQTFLISPNSAEDITGTKIASNKALAVITGHQCGNVPETMDFCEQLAVQVPPTKTWGREFMLAPFAIRTSGQYYKLVASEGDTDVVYKCTTTLGTKLANPGDSYVFKTEQSDYCYLVTSKPVFVVQLALGGYTADGGDNLGDPVMAIVSPVQQYVSGASFLSLETKSFQSHAISVTVPKKFFRSLDILLDGLPLDCKWNEIRNLDDCVTGFGCAVIIDSGPHTISHSGQGGLISVMAYGFDSTLMGYAYLTGLNLQAEAREGPEVPEVEFPEAVPYYDLSTFPGVKELNREKDANSEPINIPNGMLFGDRLVTQAYVSENGYVSFDQAWKFTHPSRFPPEEFYPRSAYMIAPFWSDNDIRKAGTVYYVDFEKGDSGKGNAMLKEVNAYLEGRRAEDDESDVFEGTWMLLAQWEDVHPDPHGADDHMGVPEALLARTNTYQAVIISDGINSYNLFTYSCGDVQWSTSVNKPAAVGYNAGGSYFWNHRSSGYETVANDVSCVVEIGSRKKRQPHGFTTVVTQNEIDDALAQTVIACRNAYTTDTTALLPQFTDDANEQPCPCTMAQANGDSRFEPDTQFGNAAGNTCFLQATLATGTYAGGTMEYGQQCCYDGSGALITTPPNAGTMKVVNIGGAPNPHDKDFYDSCCVEQGGTGCILYYAQRPIGTCDDYEPPVCCGGGTGDPHYINMFGQHFDFHANGEYLLMEAGPDRSQVQGHLQKSGYPALHRAFAFGEPGRYAYQLTNPSGLAYIFVKTQGPGTEGGPMDIRGHLATAGSVYYDSSNRMSIKRISGSTYFTVTFFSSGLSFDLKRYGSYSDITNVAVPAKYAAAGMSRGIIGTTGGCCEQWRVQAADSMFAYHNYAGRKRRQTPDEDFGDLFPETSEPFSIANLNYTDEQREFCNEVVECMFDLMVTGIEDLAATTRTVDEAATQRAKELSNFPPNITGESVFKVTVGEESVYEFSVVDEGDTFTVKVKGKMPPGAALNDEGGGGYTYRWALKAENAADIEPLEFLATDSGDASSLLNPPLEVCPCANGGECTTDGIINTAVPVLTMNCYCPDAYGGDFCEQDRNGCAEIQCFEGVECRDVPAPGVGAMCAECPKGYTGDGEKCYDIDECEADSTVCEQICNNTIGSYECSCEKGYQLVSGTNECEDVNECKEAGQNDCQQKCENTEGSYECSCQDGFTLNADGKSCDADDPCSSSVCSHSCAVIGGEDQCFCPVGLVLSELDTFLCIDEDECATFEPCDQVCSNTYGSFECYCEDGYLLLGDSCEDMDECTEALADSELELCPAANTVCENTDGSFKCVCVPGYELMDGECQRIEEMPEPPVQVTPETGKENSVTYTITAYGPDEVTAEVIQDFKHATAQAVTRYCSEKRCTTIDTDGNTESVTDLITLPENVAVPMGSMDVDKNGNPVVTFYVQFSETVFLIKESLFAAVQAGEDYYRQAGLLKGGAFAFINKTPTLTLEEDGTYTVYLEFSSEEGGTYSCILQKKGSDEVKKKDCTETRGAEFTGLLAGKTYIVKVRRILDEARQTIQKKVKTPKP